MLRRSTRARSPLKREPSLSPSLSDDTTASFHAAKLELEDMEGISKTEKGPLAPVKTGKRKRKGKDDPKEPPSPKREARYRKSYVATS